MPAPDFVLEAALIGLNAGHRICGVDEAGRGPCAGPLCVAAVILDPGTIPDGLNDSKALSEAHRFALEPVIKATALAWSVVEISPQEIDRLNILKATMQGMAQAVRSLSLPADQALIDGNRCPELDIPAHAIVKGDARSLSIAAASILAKTARDRIMIEMDALYPVYGFKGHKGYQAARHIEALRRYGPSPIHRRSWATVRSVLEATL